MSNAVEVSKGERTLASVTESQGFYTSLSLATRADKMKMLNVINNSEPLLEMVGKQINIKDVVLQTVEIANPTTGEVESTVRITLVDEKGTAYHATSIGIAQSLRQLFNIVGDPETWGQAITANVLEKKGRNGFRFLTLDFVE